MPFSISGRFWTTDELMAELGVSRQQISKLAAKHKWAKGPGRGLWSSDDAEGLSTPDGYLMARDRKAIMGTRELIVDDVYDYFPGCPECGAFALIWPPECNDRYKCIHGHFGPLPIEEE